MAQPDDILIHYGTKHHSGRYPWGSGQQPMQSGRDLLGQVAHLRRQGMTEKQIATSLNLNTTELRAKVSIAKSAKRQNDANMALRLKDKGLSNSEVGRRMGLPESSVRQLIDPAMAERRNSLEMTSNFLKEKVDKEGPIDIGTGAEAWRGISKNKLATSVAMLKEQGYVVRNIQVPQLGTRSGQKTTVKVLAPPGSEKTFIKPEDIKSIAAFSEDGGRTITAIKPPVPVSSKRVSVVYGDEGGDKADGVIFVRPGVPDVSLGGSRYAQVRIAVDKTHYLKGMAMYKDGLPPGVDLQFNTKAKRTGNKLDAMKPVGKDPTNPFGSSIDRQRTYVGKDGKTHQSAMNIVNEEGRWRDWRPSLSSQVLSKQSTSLAKKQLDLALAARVHDLNEIRNLTNPVVRHRLLTTFGDEADRASVDLKAHAMPGQGTHVILPFQSIKKGEVYAPNFNNGERVVLIRHPHGGTFEIPELVVNNRNREARATLGPGVSGRAHAAVDAIGIHPSVADRLSGADFDGDAVLVIPNPRGAIKTTAALSGLQNFKPHEAFPPYDGMKTIDGGTYNAKTKTVDYHGQHPRGAPKQQQMGDVSNLITDMTILGARPDEIAAAVRHSMVVIDAEKHHLDVQASRDVNNIDHLKERYQGRVKGRLAGASTIVSRASSEMRVPERTPRPARRGGAIDPVTGRKVFEPTGRSFTTKEGKTVHPTTRTTKLAEAVDARSLVSKAATPMELIYADHANSLKSLANQARLESLGTGGLRYSSSAAKTYAAQVKRLNAALNLAEKNAPLERQAQLIGNASLNTRLRSNPHLKADPDAMKKARFQELERARSRVGAKKHQIDISDDEWQAIQSGAISTHKLRRIIANSDIDKLRVLATPRSARVMSPAKLALARSRLSSGHTQAEVARSLGIPASTLNAALLRGGG
jgi:hypothetical protein